MSILAQIVEGVNNEGGLLKIGQSVRDTFGRLKNWDAIGLDYDESELNKDYGYDYQFSLGSNKFKDNTIYGIPRFIWAIIIIVISVFVLAVLMRKLGTK